MLKHLRTLKPNVQPIPIKKFDFMVLVCVVDLAVFGQFLTKLTRSFH